MDYIPLGNKGNWAKWKVILGLQPRDKAAMLGGQYNKIFCRRIYMTMEFSSQRKKMILVLATNLAAVTSRANQFSRS